MIVFTAFLAAILGGTIVHLSETSALPASPESDLARVATAEQKDPPSPISGPEASVRVLRVVDGDTFALANGERVRLIGIDTPESVDPRKPVQCFGKEAAAHMRTTVEGKSVRLVADIEDRDKYGRLLRYTYLSDGTFVNLALVRDGYARAYTYPPNVAHAKEFVAAEREAREAKRGLWGAVCMDAAPQLSTSTATDTPTGCSIKGNIGSTGERIYHLPSCPYYAKTRIDTAKGERMFCAEKEAQSAGWRKAKNCP